MNSNVKQSGSLCRYSKIQKQVVCVCGGGCLCVCVCVCVLCSGVGCDVLCVIFLPWFEVMLWFVSTSIASCRLLTNKEHYIDYCAVYRALVSLCGSSKSRNPSCRTTHYLLPLFYVLLWTEAHKLLSLHMFCILQVKVTSVEVLKIKHDHI